MEMAKRLVRKDGVDGISQEHAEQVAHQEDINPTHQTQQDSPTSPEHHEASRKSPAAAEATSHPNSSTDSWAHEFPPLNINHDALAHIATHFLPGNHGACTSITPLPRGTFHEILLLGFDDGWSCIGRFCRDFMHLGYMESEVATMELVRKETDIPVPRVYFANFNENHVVGAPFLLMERMEGENLSGIWDQLGIEEKKEIVEQVALVVADLASLRFEKIGFVTSSGIGPMLERHYGDDVQPIGPFKTMLEYSLGMIDASPANSCCEKCIDYCDYFRAAMKASFSTQHPGYRFCNAPFGVMHYDLDLQNILVDHSDKSRPPKLTAIIDWDGTTTQPFYYLLDHPTWLRDSYYRQDDWATNKILRKHFVSVLKSWYPEGAPQRKEIYDCFRLKTYLLHNFIDEFPAADRDHDARLAGWDNFLHVWEQGQWGPYGIFEWEADSDSEFEYYEREDDSGDEGEVWRGNENDGQDTDEKEAFSDVREECGDEK